MRLFFVFLLAAVSVPGADPILTAFKTRYETAKLNFVESVAAMPAESLEFKLTPEQRSFRDWITHTAGMNYNACSAMAGTAPPAQSAGKAMTKPAVDQAIRDSFDYCDQVIRSLSDARLLREVSVGTRTILPVDTMLGYIANLNAHYGNIVGYMRVKGVTPPSTARAAHKK